MEEFFDTAMLEKMTIPFGLIAVLVFRQVSLFLLVRINPFFEAYNKRSVGKSGILEFVTPI
jgi:hypothetical protein